MMTDFEKYEIAMRGVNSLIQNLVYLKHSDNVDVRSLAEELIYDANKIRKSLRTVLDIDKCQ